MKVATLSLIAASLLVFAFYGGNQTLAQEAVQVAITTTSAGTISDFGPESIVVKTDAAEPVRYTYSKSTTYVDEAGNPVSIETVKSGLPVTVYYVKEGDNLIASKVVVRKAVIQPPASNVQDIRTTTTTTTTTDK